MVIISILPIRKLSLREGNELAQGHTAGRQWHWDLLLVSCRWGLSVCSPLSPSAWHIIILTCLVNCIFVYKYCDCSVR